MARYDCPKCGSDKTQSTTLVKRLVPPQPKKKPGSFKFLASLVIAGVFWEAQPLIAGVFGALALLTLVEITRAANYNSKVPKLRKNWEQCFFCHRCGKVFHPDHNEGAPATVRQ